MGAGFQHAIPVISEQYKTDKCKHFKGFKIINRYACYVNKPMNNEIYTERVNINAIFCEERIIKKGFYF